jgi:hypothetical protein
VLKSFLCFAVIGSFSVASASAATESVVASTLQCKVSAADKQNPAAPAIVFVPETILISKESGAVSSVSKETGLQANIQLDGIPPLSKNFPHVVSMEANWSGWEVSFVATEAAEKADLKTTVSRYEVSVHCEAPKDAPVDPAPSVSE